MQNKIKICYDVATDFNYMTTTNSKSTFFYDIIYVVCL